MGLLRIELGNPGSLERYRYPVGIALSGVSLLYWIFMNLLLTVTGVIFVAKELPLDDTLDICTVRWWLRTLEKTWKDLSKMSACRILGDCLDMALELTRKKSGDGSPNDPA